MKLKVSKANQHFKLSMLGKNFSRCIFKYFSYSSQETDRHFMQIVNEMSKPIFRKKKKRKKIIISLSSAEFAQGLIKVNNYQYR